MQQSPADKLAALDKLEREAFLSTLSNEEAEALLYDWRGFHARPDQIPPEGDWDIWMPLAGRGWGKTRTGAEWVREKEAQGCRNIALIAETAADGRDVMVEGVSGILSVYPPDQRPLYEPSKRRITWKSGAIAIVFNATEPDQLRGPQFDAAWCDELAKWQYARETWDMLQFALRLGEKPQTLVTTTPRNIPLVKSIIAQEEGTAIVTTGSTMDNRSNLSSKFIDRITKRYEGTRLGRQELEAHILSDIPGALWSQYQIDAYKLSAQPTTLGRTVVAVDPAVTSGEDADEHGVVVCAQDARDKDIGYILADGSVSGTPERWARRALALFDEFEADRIIAESNQGGEMVESVIKAIRPGVPVKLVRASKGKHVRAEPISALYEQGRVRHVGSFSALEQQMCMMTNAGYEGDGSPDRVDALVWGMTELFPSMASKPKKKRTQKFVERAVV